MKKLWMLGALLLVLTAALAAWAEEPRSKEPTVCLDVTKADIAVVAKEIEKQTGVTVLVDKSATASITAKLEGLSADKTLALICRNSGLQVRKVYVTAKALSELSASRLAEAVAAIADLESRGQSVVVADAEGKEASAFTRKSPMETVQSAIIAKDPDFKLVYLITGAGEKTAASKPEASDKNRVAVRASDYANAEKQRLEILHQLSPDQQRQALQQGWQMMGSDPAIAGALTDTFRDYLNTLPSPKRQEILRKIGLAPIGVAPPVPKPGQPGIVPSPGGGPRTPGGMGPGGGPPSGGNPGNPGVPPEDPEDLPPPPPM